jgi:hypothetical protein
MGRRSILLQAHGGGRQAIRLSASSSDEALSGDALPGGCEDDLGNERFFP